MVRWRWLLAACVLCSGCDDGGSESSEVQEMGVEDPTGRPDGGGEFGSCEQLDQGCQGGAVCDAWTCGGPPALYNHGGCPRTPCDRDEACPSGEACYARVYGGACLPARVECNTSASACECVPSDDCEGIFDAHCLPIEVYSPDTYCDPAAYSCTELPQWLDALQRASAEHMGQGAIEMAQGLSECADRARDALVAC